MNGTIGLNPVSVQPEINQIKRKHLRVHGTVQGVGFRPLSTNSLTITI